MVGRGMQRLGFAHLPQRAHVSAGMAGKNRRRPIHVPLDDDDDVQFVGHCPADVSPSPSAPLTTNVSIPSISIPSAALRRLKCFGLAAVLISRIASCARTPSDNTRTPDRHLLNVLAAGDSRSGLRAIVIERLRFKSQVECARALHARAFVAAVRSLLACSCFVTVSTCNTAHSAIFSTQRHLHRWLQHLLHRLI